MRTWGVVALALLLAAGLLADRSGGAATADDGGRPFRVVLSGAAEVPPADPDGSGIAELRLNPGQGAVRYTLTVAGITLTFIAAHIHEAPAGDNGPIVVGLPSSRAGTSGRCVPASRALILAMLRQPENYYVNVHTTDFPGGAVRGQLAK